MKYRLSVVDEADYRNDFVKDHSAKLQCLLSLTHLYDVEMIEEHLDDLLAFKPVAFDIPSYGKCHVRITGMP